MSLEYRPLSGVGRFNAKLDGNVLRIKHRLSLVSTMQNQPTAAELALFQTDFQNLVTAHWEQKFMFQRAGVNVKPKFVLKFLDVSEQAQAHFVVNLSQGGGGSENIGRDAHFKHTGAGDAAPRTASLFTGSTQQPQSAALIAADLPKVFPYYVDFFNGAMSTQTKSQVESLMRQVSALNAATKMYVTGYGPRAAQDQQTVTALLRQLGLTNVHNRTSKKVFIPSTWGTASASKMSGRTEYVKISLKEDLDTQSLLAQTNLYSYPATVVHEYGHMLGLQDEYHCLSAQAAQKLIKMNLINAAEQQKFENFHYAGATQPSDRVANGQKEFVKYCQRAGVEYPSFGRHSTSIMSAGNQFIPAHFVWVWHALTTITTQNDWSIVPHA